MSKEPPTARIEIWAVRLPPGLDADADLARLISASATLETGDVVVVTSKVVSKVEGRTVAADREQGILDETVRVVARMGPTVIALTRHGLVMAAAGVDASNTPAGTSVLLPLDPDASARRLRRELAGLTSANVAVVVTDTAGRAWRLGQTDIAIGAAGLAPLHDLRGTVDAVGRDLAVTMPAVGDELAAAGDLVKGKATDCPVAVVRGLSHWVLDPSDDGPGAGSLVRDPSTDQFGLGARDAVRAAALRADAAALAAFPALRADDVDPFEGLDEDPAEAGLDDLVRLTVTRGRDESADGLHGRTHWTVRVLLAEGSPTSAAVLAGRLAERADTLAAGAGLNRADPGAWPIAPDGWEVAFARRWWSTRPAAPHVGDPTGANADTRLAR